MKILVLQLARLGDILQTWPTVRALSRDGHEVSLAVRPRFKAAIEGMDSVRNVHFFETRQYLEPIFNSQMGGVSEAMRQLDRFFEAIVSERYDMVINLSFSALSSWICHELECRSGGQILVKGYSRYSDGVLGIADDTSAYFYAQVGVGRPNRIPITHLFAAIAGVDLVEDDWARPTFLKTEGRSPANGYPNVLVHIGASEGHKSFSSRDWVAVLNQALQKTSSMGEPVRFGLVGSAEEAERGEAIASELSDFGDLVVSYVGRTTFKELWSLAYHADLILGGDSVMAQMAPLVGVPMLNMSTPTVSHWETGPLSRGSRIVVVDDDLATDSQMCERIADELTGMLKHIEMSSADRVVGGPIEALSEIEETDIWLLVKAIYMGGTWPVRPELEPLWKAWSDLANIEEEQTQVLLSGRGERRAIAELLNQIDGITEGLAAESPWAAVLADWWKTERLRVPPGTLEETSHRFLDINRQLKNALQNLRLEHGVNDDGPLVEL